MTIISSTILQKLNSKKLLSFELNDNKVSFIREFDLKAEKPNQIASFFTNYRDEFDVPYYCLIASLIFIDETQEICICGNRDFDTCIIGCSDTIFNKIKKLQLEYRQNKNFVTFMNIHEFLGSLKNYLTVEKYNHIKKEVLINYLK